MRLRTLMIEALTLFLAAAALFGQEYRGSILGRVTDQSGAVVPDAEVTVTNTATNVRLTTKTNAEGDYRIPYLQPGTYGLRVAHQGFTTFERQPIELRIDQLMQVDAQLRLGSATETLNVTAETPLLDTASAAGGQTVDDKRVEELPIQQGVPFHLMSMAAGMTRPEAWSGSMADEHPYDWSIIMYSFQGASDWSNIVTIDGAVTGGFQQGSTIQGGSTMPSYSPPAEAVGEMRVMTSPFDATQGFTQGANVSVSLKSGTNTPHGAIYDYGGGDGNLIANNYFNVLSALPKSPSGPYYRRGFAFGGPVYVPKVYNGKNRTFFFFSLEKLHQTTVTVGPLTVPTVPERTGNFSALLALASQYQLYDPFSRQTAPNGRLSSTPIPGNIIAPSHLSPIATGLLQYFALPNATVGVTPNGGNNYLSDTWGQLNKYWTTALRLDHTVSSKQRIYGSMHMFDRTAWYGNFFNNDASGAVWTNDPRGGVIDDVYVFNPSFIMDARMGFDDNMRTVNCWEPACLNWRYAANGFPVSMDSLVDPSIEHMPYFSPAGYQNIPGPDATLQYWQSYTYSPSVHFTKTHGAQTLNFGWEMLVRREDDNIPGLGASGNFVFGGELLAGPLDNNPLPPIGAGLAQMLQGLPTTSSIDRVPNYATQSVSHGLYLQDDWRVSPRLTLNLGLRYEYWGPASERFNRSTDGWNPSAPLSIASQVQANYLLNPTPELKQLPVQGGLLFEGVNGQPHGLWRANSHDFMPRFGFAYKLDNKTVIRGGYGIYFGAGGIEHSQVVQTGFEQLTTTTATTNGGLTYGAPLSNPFPAGVLAPTGASLGAMTYAGNSFEVINTKPPALYVQRWQLNVQRELPARVVVSVSYAGNRGTHLDVYQNLDALPDKYLSTSPVRDQTTINYLTTNMPNPFYPLLPGTGLANTIVPRTQLLLPYPQFTAVYMDTQQGYSFYNALMVQAERRFGQGLTMQLAYTFSRDMDATNYLNAGDPVPYYDISHFDFPHYFTATGIYELPFGRGKKLLGGSSKALNSIVGGWQIQGVFRYQSGPALNFGDALLQPGCTFRQIAGLNPSVYNELNTACFATNPNQQLADNLRTFPLDFSYIRGPAFSVTDLSGIKKFKVRERFNFEFRLEFLNAFNHPWLGGIDTTPTDGTFGQALSEQSSPRRVYWSGLVRF